MVFLMVIQHSIWSLKNVRNKLLKVLWKDLMAQSLRMAKHLLVRRTLWRGQTLNQRNWGVSFQEWSHISLRLSRWRPRILSSLLKFRWLKFTWRKFKIYWIDPKLTFKLLMTRLEVSTYLVWQKRMSHVRTKFTTALESAMKIGRLPIQIWMQCHLVRTQFLLLQF